MGWAIMRNNSITPAHILGTMNVEANVESRSSETPTEEKLNESYFHSTLNHFRRNTSVNFFPTFFLLVCNKLVLH